MVLDYFIKYRLAKLGYVFDGSKVDDIDVEVALMVSSTIDKVREAEAKKANKVKRSPGRR